MQGPGGSGCGLVRGLVYASRLPRALAALAHFVSSSTLLQFCFNFTASCSQVLFASDRVTKKTTPKFDQDRTRAVKGAWGPLQGTSSSL